MDLRALVKDAIADSLQGSDPDCWFVEMGGAKRGRIDLQGCFDLTEIATDVLNAIASELNARADKAENTMSGMTAAPMLRQVAGMLEV